MFIIITATIMLAAIRLRYLNTIDLYVCGGTNLY